MNKPHLVNAWAEFLMQWHWDWFVTLTFRKEPHPEHAVKAFNHWINQLNRLLYSRSQLRKGATIRWCRAIEYHKSGIIHFHALLGDSPSLNHTLSRIASAQLWLQLEGFSWVVPIDSQVNAVCGYVSKYVAKGGQIDLSPDLIRRLPQKVG